MTGSDNLRDINKLIKLFANTNYTLKFYDFSKSNSNMTQNLGFFDNEGNFINGIDFFTDSITFATENECYLDIRRKGNSGSYSFSKIQLEKGSTSTDYVEHKQQTFTFPLGNEKLMLGDYLADDGIHHVRKQVEVYISYIATLSNENVIGISNLQGKINKANNYLISEKAIFTKNTDTNYQQEGTVYENASNVCFVGNTEDTLQSLRNKYNGSLVEYELEQEVITPYTSAQQRVYNEIKNAYSYDEMTIITGSSDGNKPFFTVQIYKDLNKDLNKNSNLVNGSNTGSLRSISSAIENGTYTMGIGSFAVGADTQASGEMSYAEGEGTKATGWTSHSEGTATEANGDGSHSEGYESKANGIYSHTEGFNTQADGYNQHVEGMNNIVDINNKYAHIIGNGQSDENRSNAHTVDWQGNGWFQGNVKVGGTSQDDTNAQNLITEDKYNRLKATLPTTGEVTGQDITLDKTAEFEFIKPPLPMGNSEQVQYSGKNLFLPTLTEQTTSNNVTCTPNGDGTFTLNGTSNDSGRFIISSTPDKLYFTLEELGFSLNDQGFLNGCPVGGSDSTPTTSYKLFMSGQSGASNINDGGSGSIINANSSNMNGKYYLSIDYASGVTFNNLVFKPMIVKGITTSTDYEPYVRTELQAPHQIIHKL